MTDRGIFLIVGPSIPFTLYMVKVHGILMHKCITY
jgi:hypothetical protein